MCVFKQWSGRQPPECIDAPPSQPLLKHILNQVYNRAVTNPEALNSYEPFSPEVYGETSYELVNEIVKHTHLSESDIFVDLGSGRFRGWGLSMSQCMNGFLCVMVLWFEGGRMAIWMNGWIKLVSMSIMVKLGSLSILVALAIMLFD